MWADSFTNLIRQPKTLCNALITGNVLPYETTVFERASAVIAARLAVAARQWSQRFIFMVPPPVGRLSYEVAAGLLLADFFHSRAPGHVPPQEAGPLLGGDLLVITHAVGESVELLRTLRLGDQKLQDIWFVESFSRYRPLTGLGPRVFVANAGWILEGLPGGQITGVVIDATHPRTANKLPKLLEKIGEQRLQLIVSPPLLEGELSDLGYPDKTRVWLWDPAAKRTIKACLSDQVVPPLTTVERSLYICLDTEVDNALAVIHDLLVTCQKSGNAHPAVWEAWSIYQRLRQLTVPLAQFEDTTYTTWGAMPLIKRIERLQSDWPDAVTLEALWPSLNQQLHKVYEILLNRQEPAKFWAIAERVQARLANGSDVFRIVVPSEREGIMLNINLSYVVDEWLHAQQEGRVEVIWSKEEERRISSGDMKPALIAGFRIGPQRHLDLYPGCPLEIIAYPYEAEIDAIQQDRIYGFAENLQDDVKRTELLTRLSLPSRSAIVDQKSPRPLSRVVGSFEPRARPARVFSFDPTARDIDHLAETGLPTSWDEDARIEMAERKDVVKERGKVVQVTFEGAKEVKYAVWQWVDVYHPGTGDIQHYRAEDLRPGLRVILLVDGVYENLFDRLLDALKARANPYTLMILGLWDRAKAELIKKHGGNRKELHRQLQSRGLTVDYAAMLAWFRDESLSPQIELELTEKSDTRYAEIIAPQQYADMKILAEDSGMYPDEGMTRVTFKAIQEERGRRRKAGHALHDWLRAIVSGEGYERATTSARELGSEVAEVLAAVDVREVRQVRVIDQGQTGSH